MDKLLDKQPGCRLELMTLIWHQFRYIAFMVHIYVETGIESHTDDCYLLYTLYAVYYKMYAHISHFAFVLLFLF